MSLALSYQYSTHSLMVKQTVQVCMNKRRPRALWWHESPTVVAEPSFIVRVVLLCAVAYKVGSRYSTGFVLVGGRPPLPQNLSAHHSHFEAIGDSTIARMNEPRHIRR